MNNIYIYGGIGVLVVVVIIVVIIMMKKKKTANSAEPIHKEYDASIANVVNSEPIKGGTFIPNDPVNPNATPMPIPTVIEPAIETGNPNMMVSQTEVAATPLTLEPSAPVAPTTLAMETPVQPTMEIPTPIAPETTNSVMPNLSAPIMPSLTETPVAPVAPVEEVPVAPVAPVTPIMPDLMAPPTPTPLTIDTPVVAPVEPVVASPVDVMAPQAAPMNMNVGMVAEPLIEQAPVVAETPAAPEVSSFNLEIPVVETAPMPEVAQVAAAPVMQNTEIAPVQAPVIDPMAGVMPTQPKKEPMFVFDMPEEQKIEAPLHQNIEVDVPDMEEMI